MRSSTTSSHRRPLTRTATRAVPSGYRRMVRLQPAWRGGVRKAGVASPRDRAAAASRRAVPAKSLPLSMPPMISGGCDSLPAQLAYVGQLLLEPPVDVVAPDAGLAGRVAVLALLAIHHETIIEGAGLLLDVEGMQGEGEGAHLLVGPGVLREGQHAVALVDDDRLLGHQVHAVEDG